MDNKQQRTISFCFFFLALALTCHGNEVTCARGQYWNTLDETCSNCSTCPPNTIERQPCMLFSDTTCSPFDEFDGFHQSNLGTFRTTPRPDIPQETELTEPLGEMERIRMLEGPWFPVSLALLCVLGLICVGLAAYVIYICCWRKGRVEKDLVYDPEIQALVDITGSGYRSPYFNRGAKINSGSPNIRYPATHFLMTPGGPMRLISNFTTDDSGFSAQTFGADYVYIKSAS